MALYQYTRGKTHVFFLHTRFSTELPMIFKIGIFFYLSQKRVQQDGWDLRILVSSTPTCFFLIGRLCMFKGKQIEHSPVVVRKEQTVAFSSPKMEESKKVIFKGSTQKWNENADKSRTNLPFYCGRRFLGCLFLVFTYCTPSCTSERKRAGRASLTNKSTRMSKNEKTKILKNKKIQKKEKYKKIQKNA